MIWKILLITILLPSAAFAGGDIYFGKYIEPHYRACPDGGNAQYVAGIMLDKPLGRFTPHIELQTLMDDYNGNGTFHPASIKYDLGIRADIYKGTYVDFSRMCWHPVDRGGTVEEYWLVKIGYKW